MCTRTTCRSCGKPTVNGCGKHVEQALRGVPTAERCPGHLRTAPVEATKAQKGSGFLSRLFGSD